MRSKEIILSLPVDSRRKRIANVAYGIRWNTERIPQSQIKVVENALAGDADFEYPRDSLEFLVLRDEHRRLRW